MIESRKGYNAYLKDISRYPLLTKKEEFELGRKIREEKDPESIDRLVRSNLRFVITVANGMRLPPDLPFEDLVAYGNEGLMIAALKFDERRGYRFVTYAAWWIQQRIDNNFAKSRYNIKIPAARQAQYRKIDRHMREMELDSPQEISSELRELVKAREISEEDAENYERFGINTVSLDDTFSDQYQDGTTLMDVVAYNDDAYDSVMDTIFVNQLLNNANLSPRYRQVVESFFGLEDSDQKTLEEVGENMGLTRERIRQIKEKALEKMRKVNL